MPTDSDSGIEPDHVVPTRQHQSVSDFESHQASAGRRIPFEEGKNISEVKGLESKIEETSKKLFEKAYELKALEEISKNENVNYKIIKKVFDTRSINLEELYIKIIKEKEKYFLQTFDEKLAEEKIELETLEMINKKELAFKIGKKIKIFS